LARVTLGDIASKLNVSKNTVSKALRGAAGVSDSLRKDIIKVAKDMGYEKTNSNSLISNITVLCRKTFLADVTFWPQVLYGINHYAGNNNIKLSIEGIDESKEESLEITSSIGGHLNEGFIIVGTISDALLKKIKDANNPMVVVDHFSEEIECDYINSSNKIGIYKSIKHLYENGHRNIGFISNCISAYSFIERFEAYTKYMKEFGLPIDEDFIWLEASYYDTQYLKDRIKSTKRKENFPTAWICVNDTTAIIFMKALTDMNIMVPNDASVIGFDNISELLYPGLTTVDVPKQAMGERAVEMLIERIKNPDKPYESICLNTQLIVRDSVKNIL
jgi:DNA-binding LacI/PurR family transcriptional regulator